MRRKKLVRLLEVSEELINLETNSEKRKKLLLIKCALEEELAISKYRGLTIGNHITDIRKEYLERLKGGKNEDSNSSQG